MKSITRTFYENEAEYLMSGDITISKIRKLDGDRSVVKVTFEVGTKIQSAHEKLEELEGMIADVNDLINGGYSI